MNVLNNRLPMQEESLANSSVSDNWIFQSPYQEYMTTENPPLPLAAVGRAVPSFRVKFAHFPVARTRLPRTTSAHQMIFVFAQLIDDEY
jgi:hypothetical protein